MLVEEKVLRDGMILVIAFKVHRSRSSVVGCQTTGETGQRQLDPCL